MSSSSSSSKQQHASTPASTQQPLSSQCQKCVQMLKNVLMSDESSSRALELLRAMSSGNGGSRANKNTIQETTELQSNGVVIQLSQQDTSIASTPKTSRRRLSTVLNRPGAGSMTPVAAATAATSASNRDLATHQQEHTMTAPMTERNINNLIHNNNNKLKIECRPCGNVGPEGGARAYVMGPSPLSVVLCSNRLETKEEVDQVLVHELIHVFDVMTLKLDLRQCQNLAYSEIRAARHAECFSASQNFFSLPLQNLCIQQKATVATQNLFPRQGKQCVSQVFAQAMADTRPFGDAEKPKRDHSPVQPSQR